MFEVVGRLSVVIRQCLMGVISRVRSTLEVIFSLQHGVDSERMLCVITEVVFATS